MLAEVFLPSLQPGYSGGVAGVIDGVVGTVEHHSAGVGVGPASC